MKIHIAYATHTGSTLYAAKELLAALADSHEVVMKTANETSLDDLQSAEVILIGSSSWDWQGNRGYPLAEMMGFLGRVAAFDFSAKKVALFGCGDRDFEHFCGALDVIWDGLETAGAKYLVEHLRLNRYFMDEIGNQDLVRGWAGTLITKLKEVLA